MEMLLRPPLVDELKRPRLSMKKLDELRRRAAKLFRGSLHISGRSRKAVERLGQQRGKIVMAGIDGDPAGPQPRLPELARRGVFRHGLSDRQRKVYPEPEDRPGLVFRLAAQLGGLGRYARGLVSELHGRFDLVPMLPPRAGTPQMLFKALRKKFSGRQGRRM